jgi:hypothetical protein
VRKDEVLVMYNDKGREKRKRETGLTKSSPSVCNNALLTKQPDNQTNTKQQDSETTKQPNNQTTRQ